MACGYLDVGQRQRRVFPLVLLAAMLLPSLCRATEIIVYWNSSSPIFRPTGLNFLPVQLHDRILFVCPTDGAEFYEIYWTTSIEQWRRCSGGKPLFSCRQMASYLVDVRLYSADPTAPVFSEPVYFYTPSRGDLLGIDQREGGACRFRNMRLKVGVADSRNDEMAASTTAPPPSTSASPPDQPRPPSSAQSTVNNEMLQASRTTFEKDQRRYQQRLNLITGVAAASSNFGLVSGLTLCSALLSRLLTGLT